MSSVNVLSENFEKLSPQELVDRGLVAHQQGDLDSAACLYQAAIEQDNHQSDALHLLGMIAFQLKQPDKAEQLILLAIKNNPDTAVYYNNLGNVYLSCGSIELAMEAYQQAVKLKDDYAEAKFNLANAYVEFGDSGLAEIFYMRTLEITPDFTPALNNLAELYVAQQKWFEALGCYESLYKLDPGNADYAQRLSDLLTVVDADAEHYVANLRRAIELDQSNIDAQLSLANFLAANDKPEEAECLYDSIIEMDASIAEAYFGKANILKQNGEIEQALYNFQSAIEINPHYVDAIYNFANTSKALGDLDEAGIAYRKVLALQENHLGALVNLAVILAWQGSFTDALKLLDLAESITPNNAVLQNNLGMVNHLLRNFDKAKIHYARAMELEANSEVKWNLGLTLLTEGNFTEGFSLLEHRWDIPSLLPGVRRQFQRREWKGEDLKNKTILVYFEQGYGDAIQFARFIPVLLQKGANVILEVPIVLNRLMQTLDERISVITNIDDAQDFDYHCPIMSLAHRLGVTVDNIPNQVPYFAVRKPNQSDLSFPHDKLKVGIAWAGNPRKHDIQTYMIDRRRSCDLSYFEALNKLDTVKLYSLQHDQRPPFTSGIIDAMTEVTDFKDTAEIIQQLDLVISVDTAVAHLAGALGKPVWLLSRYDACWRWLNDRSDSPWYPDMKIFRQPSPGDWDAVFNKVKQALLDDAG